MDDGGVVLVEVLPSNRKLGDVGVLANHIAGHLPCVNDIPQTGLAEQLVLVDSVVIRYNADNVFGHRMLNLSYHLFLGFLLSVFFAMTSTREPQ
jgi:hypothetical protein